MNFPFIFFILLLSFSTAKAHCPLCTGAVGAAAVSASYFGFDASVIGVFVGAFAVSTGMWFGSSLKKNYVKFQLPTIVIASFLLTIIPVMSAVNDNMLFFAFSTPIFMNKLLFGGILGGIAVPSSYFVHKKIKERRGRVLFPYQGVVFTLLSLLLIVASLYFVV